MENIFKNIMLTKAFWIWLPKFIIDELFTIFCYITNPLVVLFLKKDWNLPAIFSWWQTHDSYMNGMGKLGDGINAFDETNLGQGGSEYFYKRYFNMMNGNWFKRYWVALLWIYRNTGYGFSFNVLGFTINKKAKIAIHNGKFDGLGCLKVYITNTNGSEAFQYYYAKKYSIFGKEFKIRINIGYKFWENPKMNKKYMIVSSIVPIKAV